MNSTNIINPDELLLWIGQNRDYQLIDISDDNLLSNLNIKSDWIPAHTLLNRITELQKTKPVVLSCRVGADSFMMMNILVHQHSMHNVMTLRTGFYGLEQVFKSRIPNSDNK
jgi:rhodanese-related sulfurtransferase